MTKLDKRTEILSAALELITERGFHAAPMAMIAARAKVAAGTIYCYFESKDVLIMELYRHVEEKILAEVMDETALGLPLRERFIFLFRKLINCFLDHPAYFSYVEQFHHSPFGADYRRDKILNKSGDNDHFRHLFEEGVALGVIKDFPLPLLFALAFGPLLAVVRDHVLGFINLDEALIEDIAASCWDGVKRQSPDSA